MRDRFIQYLAANGVPIDTCSQAYPFTVTYQRPLSSSEQSAANALISAFDPSAAAQAAWEAAKMHASAQASVVGTDPAPTAARGGLRVAYGVMCSHLAAINQLIAELAAVEAKVNVMITKLNAKLLTLPVDQVSALPAYPLAALPTARPWSEVVAAAQAAIAAETNPGS